MSFLSLSRGPAATCAAVLFLGLAAVPARALTLAEARDAALAQHPDLLLARNAVGGAAADRTIAGQSPNPTLSLQTVNIDPQRGVGRGPAWRQSVDSTVGVAWQVERGRKRDLRIAGAEAGQAASRADLAETRRQVTLGATLAYYDLKRASDRLALVDDTLALQQRTIEIAQRRLQAGDIAKVDVARLQVDQARAQAERAQAEAERTMARRTLALAMGLDPSRPGDLQADDPYPEVSAAADDEPARALLRPDVLAAERRVQQARAQGDLAEALTRRDVTLGVSAERFPPDNRGSLGLSVSVPLFWQHQYEGERRKAALGIEAAELTLRRQRQQALLEVRQADDQRQAARERLQRLEGVALPAAQQAMAAIELAQQRGAASLTDVLDARRQLHAVQLDVVDARADQAKAQAAWEASAVVDAE
jgi:cobalt-zinc-cadmium efflux system outer membrane protein